MTIEPIATYSTLLQEKFGLPRQAGLADSLEGFVSLKGEWACADSLRGLEDFSHIWLIWGFHLNPQTRNCTVRPPRLGGNSRKGVFASRSPYRPNGLGMSAVEIVSIDFEKARIKVRGADLAHGTPVYDIKPYIPYSDSIPQASPGYTSKEWKELDVKFPEETDRIFGTTEKEALCQILSLDPRPQYQDDPQKEYGLLFAGRNVRFVVKDNVVEVISFEEHL